MGNRRSQFRLLSLCFVILSSAVASYAQSTSLLRGTVTDPQGAAIADANLTLTNSENGLKRSAITGANGEYQFSQVVPGTYKIEAERPGFAVLTRTDLKLLVNTPTTLDLRLDLGQTTETVNVSAEARRLTPSTHRSETRFRRRRCASCRCRPGTWSNCSACSRVSPPTAKCWARAATRTTSRSMAWMSTTTRTPAWSRRTRPPAPPIRA